MPHTHPSAHETALITGASTGIGYELAKFFSRNGHPLVLVSRNKERLDKIAGELKKEFGVSVKVLAKDLSRPGAASEIFEELERESLAVDILVNNAGFGTHGLFYETALNPQLEMIQVNVTCLTHLTRLFLPGMLARRRGRILNVASTAAFQPGPLMAVYFATKAYVLSFTEALANELGGTGVSATVLCPGATKTEFQERAGIKGMKLLKMGMMDAETVAGMGYRALMDGEPVVIAGWRNKILAFLVRFAPRSLVMWAVRFFQEKINPRQ